MDMGAGVVTFGRVVGKYRRRCDGRSLNDRCCAPTVLEVDALPTSNYRKDLEREPGDRLRAEAEEQGSC